jgi:hypothetical protein
MPKVIDILTVVDPAGLGNNTVPLTTPINQIPQLSVDTLNRYVWMLGENGSVTGGQGTWHLSINASPGDTIRWWDTAVVQDTNEDVIIVGFNPSSNWNQVLSAPVSDTKGCGIAYIKSGFSFQTLANLQFAMNSFQNNFISATVLPAAQLGVAVNYYLAVAKLSVNNVTTPVLNGLYLFDPTITIVGS